MMGVISRPTAVLAVQGAFAEHEAVLKRLGERTLELRQAGDFDQPFDRLILPGGESTTQGKLLAELGMLEPLRVRIESGMPVLATCAGLILLAHRLDAHDDTGSPRLATMDVCVRRNGYGRQLGSFHTECEMNQVAPDNQGAHQTPHDVYQGSLYLRDGRYGRGFDSRRWTHCSCSSRHAAWCGISSRA